MAMDISHVSSIPFPDPNDVQTLVSVTHPPNKTIKSGGIYPFPDSLRFEIDGPGPAFMGVESIPGSLQKKTRRFSSGVLKTALQQLVVTNIFCSLRRCLQ